jgi:hypothetical protein
MPGIGSGAATALNAANQGHRSSGGRDRTGDLRIMMPGFFVSPQNLASTDAVKPASNAQWVSPLLSNPKIGPCGGLVGPPLYDPDEAFAWVESRMWPT